MRAEVRASLQRGDRRTVIGVAEALELLNRQPGAARFAVECLWDKDAGVRAHAADVLEKYSRARPASLQRYKPALIGLMSEAEQIEVRWHLAVLVPRLRLTSAERSQVAGTLRGYLDDRSSIVKTCAMQGLYDLSNGDPDLGQTVQDLLHSLSRSGTPAMRARGRNLLRAMERSVTTRRRSV